MVRSNYFKCILGVDQTGAVYPSGKAKPLPCALLLEADDCWELRVCDAAGAQLCLESFSMQAMRTLLKENGFEHIKPDIVVVDCVLGLPKSTEEISLRRCFEEANLFALKAGAVAGRAVGEAFFEKLRQQFYPNATSHPKRECEILAKANTVFSSKPFHRNIQSGTFRIWRDLGAYGAGEFAFLGEALNANKKTLVIEGYPSLLWRKLWNQKTRAPKDFVRLVLAHPICSKRVRLFSRAKASLCLQNNVDLADAAACAVAGAVFQDEILWTRSSRISIEGWILGL